MRCLILLVLLPCQAHAQSADWTEVVFREPQVRYLLADMTGGGNVQMYRIYATEERDPDSREAIRRWDAGVRVVNMADFQRGWITNVLAKDGRAFRVTLKGTDRTITGNEVLLNSDSSIQQGIVRMTLAELSLGRSRAYYEALGDVPEVREALRCWDAGARLLNTNLFALTGPDHAPELVFRHDGKPVPEPFCFRFNYDLAYPEVNVRYFMADVALGGSLEFYRRIAHSDHEMGCLEAVDRIEQGYKITNLDEFERKRVDGKVVITRKGSDKRISGSEVKLSSDRE